MAHPEDFTRSSWSCIHFMAPEEEGGLGRELARRGMAIFEVDGIGVRTEERLFSVIAKEMRFPSYFGRNWDALDECLRDLEWVPAEGYVLFFRGAEVLWREASRLAGAFAESWLLSAEEWGKSEKPFHLIFVW